ncbi:MAG: hypothetical protein IJQ97_06495 [Paludibacteraceae bacterium]|nr:hypothetical protein [Paludibacteraceae bacterium]
MANVIPSIEIDSFSGKLSRNSRIVLRTRYGRTHAYSLDNPFRGTASAEQGATRTTFGEAVKQASAILKDPALRTEWERRYANYRKHFRHHAPTPQNPKPNNHFCSTLRGFIISTLKTGE